MAKSDKKLLPFLLYYNGEKSNPYPPKSAKFTYWELEQIWITQVRNNSILNEEYMYNFIMTCDHFLDHITTLTPISLKAFLLEQFRQMTGNYLGFEDFLKGYIEGGAK